jgi:hypothetical protein
MRVVIGYWILCSSHGKGQDQCLATSSRTNLIQEGRRQDDRDLDTIMPANDELMLAPSSQHGAARNVGFQLITQFGQS